MNRTWFQKLLCESLLWSLFFLFLYLTRIQFRSMAWHFCAALLQKSTESTNLGKLEDNRTLEKLFDSDSLSITVHLSPCVRHPEVKRAGTFTRFSTVREASKSSCTMKEGHASKRCANVTREASENYLSHTAGSFAWFCRQVIYCWNFQPDVENDSRFQVASKNLLRGNRVAWQSWYEEMT